MAIEGILDNNNIVTTNKKEEAEVAVTIAGEKVEKTVENVEATTVNAGDGVKDAANEISENTDSNNSQQSNLPNSEDEKANHVEELINPSKEFCIIGLTGKVRSGTSDVCKLLTDCDFRLPKPDRNSKNGYDDNPLSFDEEDKAAREYRIVYRYIRDNWKPFIEVNVASVIISYLFDIGHNEYVSLFNAKNDPADPSKEDNIDHLNAIKMAVEEIVSSWKNETGADKDDISKTDVGKKLTYVYRTLRYNPLQKDSLPKDLVEKQTQWKKTLDSINKSEDLFNHWIDDVKPFLEKKGLLEDTALEKHSKAFVYCFGILPVLEERIKKVLKDLKDKDHYPFLFQDFGNSIRAYGEILPILKKEKGENLSEPSPEIDPTHLFDLSERINQFIKVLRGFDKTTGSSSEREKRNASPVFVVINNFKNFYEAYYFKRRYAAFYLMAVSCEESDRKDQFPQIEKYDKLRLREELSLGKRVFKRANKENSFEFGKGKPIPHYNDFNTYEKGFLEDCQKNSILYRSYKDNLAPFILQDVISCIENSDIFVTRNYKVGEGIYDHNLVKQLARTATLIMHPGLLIPTKVERCMQIAMTAKLNSGCLSRQVGAVVTDKDYNILSLGWNDAPCGAETCIRRNLYDLINKEDERAYSAFELNNPEFRAYLKVIEKEFTNKKSKLHGLPLAFCFKDIYQGIISQRDQIYTRALHGEERAIASCHSEAIKGGYLFTTSSPCELCAKRAKEAGIERIYYIELYPGISRDHVIEVGSEESRAKYIFFVGAIGLAYVKLYTPLIPYKDELSALGFSPAEVYKHYKDKDNKERIQKED